jgi:hypothetical protein
MSGLKYKLGLCPRCGESATVRKVWPTYAGTMRRYRCSACENKFQTVEAIVCGPSMAQIGIPADKAIEMLEDAGFPIVRGRNFDDSR